MENWAFNPVQTNVNRIPSEALTFSHSCMFYQLYDFKYNIYSLLQDKYKT